MANTHARAFAGQARAWTAAEFADLRKSTHVVTLGDKRAFAVARVVADEAELLTLATDPDHQRRGLARVVLDDIETAVRAQGATFQFLEVAHDNLAAGALYANAGYQEIGRRIGYYRRDDGRRADALILQKELA